MNLAEIEQIVFANKPLSVSSQEQNTILESYNFLKDFSKDMGYNGVTCTDPFILKVLLNATFKDKEDE